MLGIDPKWLSLNKDNAEIMLKNNRRYKIRKILGKIYKNLKIYINNDKNFFNDLPDEEIFDIEKIF